MTPRAAFCQGHEATWGERVSSPHTGPYGCLFLAQGNKPEESTLSMEWPTLITDGDAAGQTQGPRSVPARTVQLASPSLKYEQAKACDGLWARSHVTGQLRALLRGQCHRGAPRI